MEKSTIRIMMPTFDRPAHFPQPPSPPSSLAEWEALRHKSFEELIDLGFGNWKNELFLVPGEWYNDLPNGLSLESINGRLVVVADGYKDINSQNYIDNDTRYGSLAYGIRRILE